MARAVIWAMGFAGFWGAFFEYTPQEENIRALMRRKLVEGQGILEGIALEDFDKIQTNAKALVEISQAETWQVVQTPEYVKHTATFRRAVDDIIKHAKQKNGDAVGLDYFRLTRSCVECHKYVRGVRLGRLDSFEDETRIAQRPRAEQSHAGNVRPALRQAEAAAQL